MTSEKNKISLKSFKIEKTEVRLKYNNSWYKEVSTLGGCLIFIDVEYTICKDLPVNIVNFRAPFKSPQELKDLVFILNKDNKIVDSIDSLNTEESIQLFIDLVLMPKIRTACKMLINYKDNDLQKSRALQQRGQGNNTTLLLNNLNVQKACTDDYGLAHSTISRGESLDIKIDGEEITLESCVTGIYPIKYTEIAALNISKWIFVNRNMTDFKLSYVLRATHASILITDSLSNCQLTYIDHIEELVYSLKKPELFMELLKELNRTLYYFHVAWGYEERDLFKKLENLFTNNGFKIIVKTEKINTNANKQTHYIVRLNS